MKAVCPLCFHHCALGEGEAGLCRARIGRRGGVEPLYYGKISALALDPVEKKPLRRFYPGRRVLSVGGFGCNLRCPFCQNHAIAQLDGPPRRWQELTPQALAEQAVQLVSQGNIGAAYTYNEPLVCYEYVRDCARAVRERGLVNVLVTNGTIEPEPWQALLPLLDAVNIDLKGFTDGWYRRLGGRLEPVQRAIALAAERCHVEVTTLLIPGENDGEEEIRALCRFLASISPEIPLHLSRFFPRYRMAGRQETPVETVHRLTRVAREYLTWVYPGNC